MYNELSTKADVFRLYLSTISLFLLLLFVKDAKLFKIGKILSTFERRFVKPPRNLQIEIQFGYSQIFVN